MDAVRGQGERPPERGVRGEGGGGRDGSRPRQRDVAGLPRVVGGEQCQHTGHQRQNGDHGQRRRQSCQGPDAEPVPARDALVVVARGAQELTLRGSQGKAWRGGVHGRVDGLRGVDRDVFAVGAGECGVAAVVVVVKNLLIVVEASGPAPPQVVGRGGGRGERGVVPAGGLPVRGVGPQAREDTEPLPVGVDPAHQARPRREEDLVGGGDRGAVEGQQARAGEVGGDDEQPLRHLRQRRVAADRAGGTDVDHLQEQRPARQLAVPPQAQVDRLRRIADHTLDPAGLEVVGHRDAAPPATFPADQEDIGQQWQEGTLVSARIGRGDRVQQERDQRRLDRVAQRAGGLDDDLRQRVPVRGADHDLVVDGRAEHRFGERRLEKVRAQGHHGGQARGGAAAQLTEEPGPAEPVDPVRPQFLQLVHDQQTRDGRVGVGEIVGAQDRDRCPVRRPPGRDARREQRGLARSGCAHHHERPGPGRRQSLDDRLHLGGAAVEQPGLRGQVRAQTHIRTVDVGIGDAVGEALGVTGRPVRVPGRPGGRGGPTRCDGE